MTNKNELISYVANRFNEDIFKHKLDAALNGFGVSRDRFLRGAMNCLANNEDLPKYVNDPMSIVMCILRAAAMRLDLDPSIAHAYIVPRGGVACLDFSYQGIIELLYRTGKVSAVNVEEVFENDIFEFETGTNPNIKHVRSFKNRGEIVAFWCCIEIANGGKIIKVMSREEIEAHRNKYSKNPKLWAREFNSMAKKTVLKQASKFAPKSVEFNAINEAEKLDNYDPNDRFYDIQIDETGEIPQVSAEPKVQIINSTKRTRLSAFVEQNK